MDENERQRFLETLRTDEAFRAAARREILIQDLLELPRTVADHGATLHTLIEHQADLQASMIVLTERAGSTGAWAGSTGAWAG